MSVVNFSVPQILNRRIKKTVQEKGFPSRAELFRFALLRYLDETEKKKLDESYKIAFLSQRLEEELSKKVSFKKLPSIKIQLKRLKSL